MKNKIIVQKTFGALLLFFFGASTIACQQRTYSVNTSEPLPSTQSEPLSSTQENQDDDLFDAPDLCSLVKRASEEKSVAVILTKTDENLYKIGSSEYKLKTCDVISSFDPFYVENDFYITEYIDTYGNSGKYSYSFDDAEIFVMVDIY